MNTNKRHLQESQLSTKEELYVIKCGKTYVRFNLDGLMIGCKRSNSVVNMNYLRKLPFNLSLAIASGIIKIENAI